MTTLPRKLSILALAALALLNCQVKDKPGKTLSSGSMNPPWDAPAFAPKRLEGFKYTGPESLFAVFGAIARIDSLVGDRSHWKLDSNGVDTVRIDQLFDTAFVFPKNPDASMPYAYDDGYRDDTLFRNAYGNGLFTQDHPCALTYVLSEPFLHPAQWLKSGLSQEQMVGALGRPAYWLGDTATAVLRYLSRHTDVTPASGSTMERRFDSYEGANFYFLRDSLFAAVLQRSQPCH